MVLKADTEPPCPVMKSATFSSDGTNILVMFDSSTNRGGFVNVFGCGLLLESSSSSQTSKISSSTRCVWLDDQSFSIYPTLSISSSSSSSSTSSSSLLLEVKDKLNLKSNSTIRAKCRALSNVKPCNQWKAADSSVKVSISPPSQPSVPWVSMVSVGQIGPCDSLSLDLSGSRGSGGRAFKNISFEVFEDGKRITNKIINNNNNNKNHKNSSISDLLTSQSTTPTGPSTSSPLTVPSGWFSPGHSYNISVKLCNFLGGCGKSSHSFKVLSSGSVPMVSINSDKVRSMKRNSMLMVSGQGSMLDCGGNQISNLKFDWSMTLLQPISNPNPSSSLKSISNDPRSFRLSPFSLSVGSVYSLTLTVSSTDSSQDSTTSSSSSSSSITVSVVQGNVVGLVSGSSEKMLSLDGSLLIDASGSYDEDEQDGSKSKLLFSYSCVQLEPSYNPSCLLNLNLNTITNQNSKFSSSSTVTVSVTDPSSLSMVDSVHEVTVTVKQRTDNRTCAVTVRVKVISPGSPRISIVSEGGLRINPSDKLKLSGEVIVPSQSSGLVLWSVDDESISLGDVSLSDIQKKFLSSSSSSSPSSSSSSSSMTITRMSLVLPSNTLPQQSTFTFTLKCFLNSNSNQITNQIRNQNQNSSSFSSITITTNSPPLPGVYEVSPSKGLMLNTTFVFVASQWEDQDIPLSYEFSYQSSSSSTSYLVHRSRQELSFASSKLPQGRSSDSNLLLTRVQVFDVLDGKSWSVVSVEVTVKKMSSLEVGSVLSSSLLLSEGDPEAMSKTISLGSCVLNSVNCSGAGNCSSLHRASCGRRSGSCGECLLGYVGESGDANTPCVSMSSFSSTSSISSISSIISRRRTSSLSTSETQPRTTQSKSTSKLQSKERQKMEEDLETNKNKNKNKNKEKDKENQIENENEC